MSELLSADSLYPPLESQLGDTVPIVTVEIVATGQLDQELPAQLADALGAVFAGPPSRTWVRLHRLSQYAEAGDGPPPGVTPIFLSILMADPPVGDERATQAAAITAAVATVCKRPVENVHVIYEPPGAGRVAFGGKLIPDPGH